jgi:citrate lyase beta subunit
MIEKAKNLPADEVFLDLEDAVAPDAKAEARTQVAVALAEPGWAGQLRGVRVNDWTTPMDLCGRHRGRVDCGRIAGHCRAAQGD